MAKEYNLNFMKSYYKVYVGRKERESLKPLIEEIVSKGIKTADATHIACAIKSDCDYLITTDYRMLKFKDPRIKMISPADMLYVVEV